MTTISWSEELSVGVHILDADHKLLIDLIKRFNGAVASGQGPDKIGRVLKALYEYTDFHFIREEALMKACGYPGLEKHHQVHEKLYARMEDIYAEHARAPSEALSGEIKTFLNQWLTKHIMGHDKRYAPTMVGKEQEIAEAHRPFLRHWSIAESADATDSY